MAAITGIEQLPLSNTQYYQDELPKVQIYLHHTAGNSDPYAVVKDWNTDERGRIATCVVIGGGQFDGKIVQCFPSKQWAFHLGVKTSVFTERNLPAKTLDKASIGIEICSWGQLSKKGNKYYNYVGKEVPAEQVCELSKPYKGFKFYHKYSTAQIAAVKQLLQYWGPLYKIPLTYKEDIWQVTDRALKGEPGVFTHNSVRADKNDVFPQPELIQMLSTL